MPEQEGASVPVQQKSSWGGFLKSISSFNGDLSSMTAPPFILSGRSLVEYSSYWAEHPSLLVSPAKEKDPAKRAMLVLAWFLSTLKSQYSSRSDELGTEKKPLNPFLGELFLGHWEDEAGKTELIAEQVSHHPPVTAYAISNDALGVRLEGYNAQKASFSTTIYVKQVGHALLHLKEHDEYFLITLPSLHIEGLIVGAPFVELDGKTIIQSSSGYTATIEYSGRGWLSGKKNTFAAALFSTNNKNELLYKADGTWSSSFQIKDSSKRVVFTHDPEQSKITPLTVAPLSEQGEMESRRAWQKVAESIAKADMEAVSREKSIIENRQREMRKQESQENREWKRRFFKRVETLPVFEKLAKIVNEPSDSDKTNGMWKFDENQATLAG